MDFSQIKSLFPIFQYQPGLVFVDNASTTQKPKKVLEVMNNFYEREYANVHRGLYKLSEEASVRFEEVRKKTAQFIHASNSNCIAFTKGTTESINIVASGFIRYLLQPGDEILISQMEHHANLIPWQQVCKEKGAKLVIIPTDDNGNLILDKLDELLNNKTKLVAITHVSNALGTVNSIKEIITQAHKKNVPVLIDAAQSVSHIPIDVNELGADFLAFSAHKLFGPMGVGVLYVDEKYHDKIVSLNFGGGAIRNVELEETEFLDYPRNLEAGTPNVPGVIGFGAALDFMNSLDLTEVSNHFANLGQQLRNGLKIMDGISIIGNSIHNSGIVSFVDSKIHPHDLASFLGSKRIAVRAGHHCTQPLLDRLGIHATVRVSFSVYNNEEDVDKIIESIKEAKRFYS
jgi:cysteine desulfurase/selenocysteine lyase